METLNINDYLDWIDRDIESRADLPKRDFSGRRTFNEGESRILKSWERQIKKKMENYLVKGEQLQRVKGEAISRLEDLKNQKKSFLEQKKNYEDRILKCKKEIEQSRETMDYYNHLKSMGDGDLGAASSKKKRNKKSTRLFSNMLMIIIVDVVVFAATWMIQRDALSWDSIIIRFVFLICIGFVSVYQLYLYQKTGETTFKTIHNITLILGFICIIDGLLIGYLMDDTTASTTLNFDLVDQVNTEQQNNAKGITTIPFKYPGIVEFLVAVLLLFYSKMLIAETSKHEIDEIQETSKETTQGNSIILKMAFAKAKISKQNRLIEEAYHEIRLWEASGSAIIEKSFQECAKLKRVIEGLLDERSTTKSEIDEIIMEETNELARYRALHLEVLSLKSGAASAFMPNYEVATENDVRQYYSINI